MTTPTSTAPPSFTPPAEAAVAASAASAGLGATETNAGALLSMIKSLQAQVDALNAGKQAANAPAVVNTARELASLVKTHLTGITHRSLAGKDTAHIARLADDTVDAANNAVASGDTTTVRAVAEKLATALKTVDPGPGDHHYYREAVAFVTHHLPIAADKITGPSPSAAPPVAGGTPVKVIAGSVTG